MKNEDGTNNDCSFLKLWNASSENDLTLLLSNTLFHCSSTRIGKNNVNGNVSDLKKGIDTIE